MTLETFAEFCIPTDNQDTEGMGIKAMAMPDQNDTVHGFIILPKTVSAENVPVLITAIQAALVSLEDSCHNHPTQPMRSTPT